MARKPKSISVYDRIEEKLKLIKETEILLAQLDKELQELYSERDEIEMKLLLQKARENGLNIEEALLKLSNKK